jgi:hypothetical protein
MEEHKLRVSVNKMLRRQEVTGGWKNRIMRNFINCTLHKRLLG